MSRLFNVAVVGATDLVGETLLALLEERDFPVDTLYPLASSGSAGKRAQFNGKMLRVESLEDFDFSKVQIALFAPTASSVSATHAPHAAEAGCVVIDMTSHFGDKNDVPLIVPEVNPSAIAQYKNHNIIASPSAITVQMLIALKPIYDAVGIERVNVATYQSVSGTGKDAIEELAAQTVGLLNGKPIEPKVYSKQIAFNALPQVDAVTSNGYTQEEMNMLWETRKVFDDQAIQINPTAVLLPVFYGHSAAMHLETRDKITAEQARELLSKAPGIEVLDEHQEEAYPTPVTEAANTDSVYVGRIREDISHPCGLNLWVVSDNMRKGAALNAIQIAEILIKDYI